MATTKITYAASAAVTIGLDSTPLASSATWVLGRESTAIDNTSNLYLDYLLAGFVTVGTTPTIDTEIRVYVVGIRDDTGWPDVFDGTDSDETVSAAGRATGILKLAAILPVGATTSDVAYNFGPVSVASLFGGSLPNKFVVFVTHNTGVALNTTAANHELHVTGVYTTTA